MSVTVDKYVKERNGRTVNALSSPLNIGLKKPKVKVRTKEKKTKENKTVITQASHVLTDRTTDWA